MSLDEHLIEDIRSAFFVNPESGFKILLANDASGFKGWPSRELRLSPPVEKVLQLTESRC